MPKLANAIVAQAISTIIKGTEVELRIFEAASQRNPPQSISNLSAPLLLLLVERRSLVSIPEFCRI